MGGGGKVWVLTFLSRGPVGDDSFQKEKHENGRRTGRSTELITIAGRRKDFQKKLIRGGRRERKKGDWERPVKGRSSNPNLGSQKEEGKPLPAREGF